MNSYDDYSSDYYERMIESAKDSYDASCDLGDEDNNEWRNGKVIRIAEWCGKKIRIIEED